jgi:hypothetical protein
MNVTTKAKLTLNQAVIATVALMTACQARTPSTDVGLVFKASASTAVSGALSITGLSSLDQQSVSLDQAWIAIKEIEFEESEVAGESESEDSNDSTEFKGPYVIDLLSDSPSPIDTSSIASKMYKRLKMKLHEVEDLPVGAPEEMQGRSILLKGFVGVHAFTYKPKDSTEFEISGPNGVTPDATANLLVNFRFSEMIAKIDMSAITADTEISDEHRVPASNPCPSIDPSAEDLFKCFREGIEQSARMGKDDDGDGELEDGEDQVDSED